MRRIVATVDGVVERILGRRPGADEIWFLVLFFAVAGCLWLFAEAAEVANADDLRGIEIQILEAFREPGDVTDPLGPVWFEQAVRDLTALGGTTILTLLSLIVAGFFVLERQPRILAFLAFAVITGLLLSLALKAGFDRPRPDFLPHGQTVYTASFPSAHSMNSAVVYLTLGAIIARTRPRRLIKIYVLSMAALITVLVGVSRVYLGVHWPTDVVAGWAAGAAWAGICSLVVLWLQRRRVLERSVGDVTVSRGPQGMGD